jgi:hypothetical protein
VKGRCPRPLDERDIFKSKANDACISQNRRPNQAAFIINLCFYAKQAKPG